MTSSVSMQIGRVLLGLYFLLPGLMKIAAPAATVAYMRSHAIAFAEPLMWVSVAANVIGGLLLLAGRHVRIVAYACVLYIVLVNVMLHDFWTMAPEAVAHERQNFVKNLAILGGLLVLASAAPARALSPKDWWRSDRAVTADKG